MQTVLSSDVNVNAVDYVSLSSVASCQPRSATSFLQLFCSIRSLSHTVRDVGGACGWRSRCHLVTSACLCRRGTRLCTTSARGRVSVWFRCCCRNTPTSTSEMTYVQGDAHTAAGGRHMSNSFFCSSAGWRDAVGHRHQTEVQQHRQHAEENTLSSCTLA